MSRRSTTTCEHECHPRDEREWVPDSGKQTTVAPTTETCRREPVEGHDYCAFHLPPDERPEHITPSAQLQERLDQLASGAVSPSDDRYTTYQGAYFDEIDLSRLNLEALSGQDVTLDFSYSKVAGGVTVAGDATIPISVMFQFSSLGSFHVEGATIRELDCTGALIRSDAPTKSVGTNKAVEIIGNSTIQTLSLPEAAVKGEILVSGLQSRNSLDFKHISAKKTHLSDIDSLLLNLEDARIGGILSIDTADLNHLSADQVTADQLQLQDVTVEETVTLDSLSASSARILQLTAAQLTAKPPRVSELRLNNLEVAEEFDIAVAQGDDEILDSLIIRNCHFETCPIFDRLTLEEGTFKSNTFRAGASFEECEIEDATFEPPAEAPLFDVDASFEEREVEYAVSFEKCEIEDATFKSPDDAPLFDSDVSFEKARLPGSEFEQSELTVAGDVNCRDAVLSDALLNGFRATGRADFTMADLTGARLLNADLSTAVLEGALLNRARLTGADLTNAYLYQTTFGNASIDSSTDFGLPVVYDPDAAVSCDPSVGLQNEADRSARSIETYMSIHNITRESGQSAVAIDAYKRRQQVRTRQRRPDSDADMTAWLGWAGWKTYGVGTEYGVGVRRLLGVSAVVVVLSMAVVAGVAGVNTATPFGHLAYAVASFVGVTLPYETTAAAQYVLTLEAILGTLLIALFVNALGRRSSM